MISQIIGYIALWLITRSGGGMDVYYEQVVLLTGLTGILSMIPCLWFYSRDRIARKHGGLVLPQKPWKLDLPEIILFWEWEQLFHSMQICLSECCSLY